MSNVNWGDKVGDMVFAAMPAALWQVVPKHLRQDALARLGDLNPFASIAANEDLLRALRLAWIQAALTVDQRVAQAMPEWDRRTRPEVDRCSELVKQVLRKLRGETFNRDQPPRPSPVDDALPLVLEGVGGYVRAREPVAAISLTAAFGATLAQLIHWPELELPTVYQQVATQGIGHGSGAARRDFGEMVFAAFAEIIKHPDKHPEASTAFQMAQQDMARQLTLQVLQQVKGMNERLSALQADLTQFPYTSMEAFGSLLGEALVRLQRIEGKIDALPDQIGHAVADRVGAQMRAALAGSAEAAPAFVWPEAQNFSGYAQAKRAGFFGRGSLQALVDDWLRAGEHRVLMLLAPFGVGKTAFMAQLEERFRSAGYTTIVHYCRFDEQETLQPGRIVQSLATQFAQQMPAYRDAVLADREAQRCIAQAIADPRAAWSRGVVDMLRALPAPEGPGHLILVDGLDESLELHHGQDKRQGSLLDLVLGAASGRLPGWLRVVISSRDVELLGPQRGALSYVDMLGPHAAANEQDLRDYIRSRLPDSPLAALLPAVGLSEEAFVGQLVGLCDGKFLLAHYVFQEAWAGGLDAGSMRRLLAGDGTLSGMDVFYQNTFERRVARTGLDVRKTVAVLGQVAVALDPLPAEAIASVLAGLQVDRSDVHAVVEAFSGLLRHDAAGGITFDHFSIEQWLDPFRPEGRLGGRDGRPKAGRFAIERAMSLQRLQAHCAAQAARPAPLAQAGSFGRYLQRYGVVHLLDAGALAPALSLLVALFRAQERQPPRLLEAQVIDAIDQALARFDSGGHDEASTLLRGLSSEHMMQLLQTRDYQTGKFEPVIRGLVQFHAQTWQDIQPRLLAQGDEDLVLRDDIGVAYAEAWHSSAGAEQQRLLAEIEAMATDAADDDRREIAGYALKHICQRLDPQPWWRVIEPTLRRLVAGFAASASEGDRMVAGEILLALALQGEPVTGDGWVADAGFWRPVWPNLAVDVAAIHVALGERPEGPDAEARLGPLVMQELASAWQQQALADALTERLLDDPLFSKADGEATLQRLYDVVLSQAQQQADKTALGDAFAALERLVDRVEHRGLLSDLVRRLMLHPLWDVTESASNLVSDLIQRQAPRGDRWWLVDALVEADPALWRLRYGGVDAAFTAGAVHGYARFRAALLKMKDDCHCRVRGICVDDLRAWVRPSRAAGRHTDSAHRRRILRDPEIAQLVQRWLTEADDSWLLEYLYLLLHDIACQEPKDLPLVRQLMPASLSRWLQLDGSRPFYLLDRQTFLERMEARGRALRAPG